MFSSFLEGYKRLFNPHCGAKAGPVVAELYRAFGSEGRKSRHLPSCHFGEHMVCIIQMGKVGSSMATPMLEKQRAPVGRENRGNTPV